MPIMGRAVSQVPPGEPRESPVLRPLPRAFELHLPSLQARAGARWAMRPVPSGFRQVLCHAGFCGAASRQPPAAAHSSPYLHRQANHLASHHRRDFAGKVSVGTAEREVAGASIPQPVPQSQTIVSGAPECGPASQLTHQAGDLELGKYQDRQELATRHNLLTSDFCRDPTSSPCWPCTSWLCSEVLWPAARPRGLSGRGDLPRRSSSPPHSRRKSP
jgi:hypothetical protein